MSVLCLDHNRKDRNGLGQPDDAPNGIDQQQAADTLAARSPVSRQPPDEGCGDGVVARELASQFRRQVGQRDRERTQTMETKDLRCLIDGYKYARKMTPLILAGAAMEPLV